MSQNDLHFHYVCTHEEAATLIEQHNQFWISNCGCREVQFPVCGSVEISSKCQRSRLDVCLQFSESTGAHGSGKRQASRSEVFDLLLEAKDKWLVARPFHKENDFTVTDGICFCCDDCCEYFLKPEEKCDKGVFIEKTDMEVCNHCGICADYCYFNARKMDAAELTLDRERCYGCGLCAAFCPEACVEMVGRNFDGIARVE